MRRVCEIAIWIDFLKEEGEKIQKTLEILSQESREQESLREGKVQRKTNHIFT